MVGFLSCNSFGRRRWRPSLLLPLALVAMILIRGEALAGSLSQDQCRWLRDVVTVTIESQANTVRKVEDAISFTELFFDATESMAAVSPNDIQEKLHDLEFMSNRVRFDLLAAVRQHEKSFDIMQTPQLWTVFQDICPDTETRPLDEVLPVIRLYRLRRSSGQR